MTIDKLAREAVRDAALEGDDDRVVQLLRDAIGDRRWVSAIGRGEPTLGDGAMRVTFPAIDLPVDVRVLRFAIQAFTDTWFFLGGIYVGGANTMLTEEPMAMTMFAIGDGGVWNIRRVPAHTPIVVEFVALTVSLSPPPSDWRHVINAALLVEILPDEAG